MFSYCADSFDMLTSAYSTALLWVGGDGKNKYIPILGSEPTSF